METIIKLKLEPHYEAEWNERIEKANKKTNQLQTDLEFARIFRENKSQFIQAAFEADLSPTPFMAGHLSKKVAGSRRIPIWIGKRNPSQINKKSMADFGTEEAKKAFQAVMAANAGPKLKR